MGAEAGWEQVFITFLDDRTVQIKAPGVNERRNFETMGMADTRKKPPEPNQVWTLLQDLALAGGEMTWKEQGASASVRTLAMAVV